MSLLELNSVSKAFYAGGGLWRRGRKIEAVKGVSLRLPPGTCLGLVGESGCGKSTLGRVVLGLERPDRGEVLFQGRNIHGCTGQQLKKIYRDMQVVFQDSFSSVNPRLTAGEIVAEPLGNFLKLSPSEKKDRIGELLDTVGLSPQDAGKYPHQFSGGQLQRVCIARAISLQPRLIVLDEAVSSLDVSVQAQILNLLADLKNSLQLSYIFISHDIEAVYYLSDSLAVMYLGRIVELIKQLDNDKEVWHPYSRKLLAAVLAPDPRRRVSLDACLDEINASDPPPAGCSYAPRCSRAGQICRETAPPLVNTEENHWVACHCL
jgi:nickel import ATP-binding protein NikE